MGLVLVSVRTTLGIARAVQKCLGGRTDSDATTESAVQNEICAYLAAVVLNGLFTNTLLHWWWLDSVMGLRIAAWAMFRGED